MSKDFARVSTRGTKGAAPARKKSAPPPSRMPAFYAGLALGLAVAVLVFLFDHGLVSLDMFKPERTAVTPAPEVKKPREPDFTFYTILPEMEVVVPEHEPEAPAAAASGAASPAPTQAAGGSYVLQAGSFRRMGDADGLKASLALLGIVSRIEVVTIDGTSYHRVRVGPYSSSREADAVRGRLRREGIDPLLLKLKP